MNKSYRILYAVSLKQYLPFIQENGYGKRDYKVKKKDVPVAMLPW